MRPPDLFLASPPLAECIARSTHRSRTPAEAEEKGLAPFHHLAPGWESGPTQVGTSVPALEPVRQDAARLRRLAARDGYARRLTGSTVVYRLESGGHRQTGVLVEGSVEDYRNGRIRRHEATDPERERRLADFLSAAQSELVPVTLVHPARPRLQTLLAEAAAQEPDLRLVSVDGLVQTAWVVSSAELARAIWAELEEVGDVYIADGHHRMAAAERHARRSRPGSPARAADHVLSALFPSTETRVLGYHRGLARAGVSVRGLLDTVARLPVTERLRECPPTQVPRTEPGVLGVWLDERWYRLSLRSRPGPTDAWSSLDIVVLEEEVLRPVLQGEDAGTHARVTYLPGDLDGAALARWCDRHDAVGFLVHPPTVEQIMAVSDAGLVMPSKSTWFDPKAGAGPFIRDISV